MIRVAGIVIALGLSAASASAAVPVNAADPTPTLIGTFAAGTYTVTATGTISLAGGAVGAGFDVDARGIPTAPGGVSAVLYPEYQYFNFLGAADDRGTLGPGGSQRNLGSLLGTFIPNPGNDPNNFFSIGTSTTFTQSAPFTLYALVNDTFYSNNAGAFQVAVVPEPHEWAMMLAGLGLVGWAARRRTRSESDAAAPLAAA